MEKERIPWDQMRRIYITTKVSYRDLAARFHVPLGRITQRGKEEGWVEKRNAHQTGPPSRDAPQRMRELIGQTMDLMEAILQDDRQFNRHFVKVKTDGDADQEERVFSKVDTKALKEFVGGLKELKTMIEEKETEAESSGIHVVFEAGEEAFNE